MVSARCPAQSQYCLFGRLINCGGTEAIIAESQIPARLQVQLMPVKSPRKLILLPAVRHTSPLKCEATTSGICA